MFEKLSVENFKFQDSLIKEIRTELYHSKKPGYYIIKKFINEKNVRHMRDMWINLNPELFHKLHPGKNKIYMGCPNYYICDNIKNRSFHNFLWAQPYDELSYNVNMYVQILRNLIEGRNFSDYIYPYLGQSSSYRIVITRNGKDIVLPHRDYYSENKFDKLHDATRLQATLFLSKNGVDYEGEGFKLEKNSGEDVIFGVDVDVEPGDLVLWRYQNRHSVANISSTDEQVGFVRILFPPEFVHPNLSNENNFISNLKKIIPLPIKKVLKKVVRI